MKVWQYPPVGGKKKGVNNDPTGNETSSNNHQISDNFTLEST